MSITTVELTSADGTALTVEQSGTGTPLLLLHGGMNSTRAFDRVLPALAARYRCLALGRRGYGQSGTSRTHSFELEAQDVAAVLASLDEPAHLFGHSSGAIAAATAALALSDQPSVRSLILYEPPFPIDGPHTGAWIGAGEEAIGRGAHEEAALIGLRDGIGFPPQLISRLRAAPDWQIRVTLAPAWFREVRSVEALPLGVDRFAAIQAPTLLITGSDTEPHHTAATWALKAVLPHSEACILPGQGHTALLLAPDQLCAALLPHLDHH